MDQSNVHDVDVDQTNDIGADFSTDQKTQDSDHKAVPLFIQKEIKQRTSTTATEEIDFFIKTSPFKFYENGHSEGA